MTDRPRQGWHEHQTPWRGRCERPPLSFFMAAGRISHYVGAATQLNELPKAQRSASDLFRTFSLPTHLHSCSSYANA